MFLILKGKEFGVLILVAEKNLVFLGKKGEKSRISDLKTGNFIGKKGEKSVFQI